MDTSSIPVDLAGLYDVLKQCALLLASFWGLPKIVQLFKR
jgi:hypothetical protein